MEALRNPEERSVLWRAVNQYDFEKLLVTRPGAVNCVPILLLAYPAP